MIKKFVGLAPAKINIFLCVKNRYKNGYHKILSLFQTVSLYDIVKVKLLNEDKIEVLCSVKDLSGEKNLCYKVADLVKKKYKITIGVRIEIVKNIPVGSGLGGGSSDAFTTIDLLNKLWNLRLKEKEILKICSEIGKDVPYFYYKGCCMVESTGEKITKVEPYWTKKPVWFLLVYPNKMLLTKDVYDEYDKFLYKCDGEYNKRDVMKYLNSDIKKLLHNDLELAAVKLLPELKRIKSLLSEISGDKVSMSGSGSSLFVIFDRKKDAVKVKHKFLKFYKDCLVYIVKPVF